jgi:hypothetical protein
MTSPAHQRQLRMRPLQHCATPQPTFTILGVDAGVSNEEGRPAREGGRMELAVLGRETWAEATEAEVDGRETADAHDADAEAENMDCQTMPSAQSLQVGE